ncbi:tRNA (adenosine(37)-N6)-threonylcarbamoyltransferase complex ATPase subunit type 1 TsaE [Candidatus Berkelbacteria bacterium RBG_13_40_8]|uniref:tRNA threonylcarbamoyladenosine biosynthesis protein TsaE n=1 Tax=Candidatus Berkelbacteria bacterium RBG_13_40_8 TaxID=1797467 RepID=A0A1F5DPI5_9BACT|nr:MAG: tRNA (adenosine(37)-N6)-threonylcarbamoyltransferase complex ATPase subunit type 1 TsaE [Candidatus Berkelbacteria bacterium RBG_13_40_8]
MKEFISKSPEDTINFAIDFAKKLKGGEILALEGELGSGKTTFVKGLAEGLGVTETILSPTFVLLKEYDILRPKFHLRGGTNMVKFVHVDAYRVETIEDIKSVGIEDYLNRNDVILTIEWADKIEEILPKNTIHVKFETLEEKTRKISIQ